MERANESKQQPKPTAKPVSAPEAVYSARELAREAERVFGKGVSPDCVVAAFRMEGVERAGIGRAKEIVQKFRRKEVK